MSVSIKPIRGAEFPRTFTSSVADFGDWQQIEPLFMDLEQRAGALASSEALERWLLDQSELGAALDEEFTRRYIAMTCDTSSPEMQKAYLDFLENVQPKTKPHWDRLNRLYLASPHRNQLDPRRYSVMDRAVENEVKLYRDANVPLQTEDAKLKQQFQTISGAMTVEFRGEKKTLPQMAPYQEETDRALREETWRLVAERRLQDRDALDDLLDQMIQLRAQMAKNAGFENFRDYQHQAYGRFDYAPADVLAFQESIAEYVVPLLARVREERRKKLNIPTLRPWDLAVDPLSRPPLRPFSTSEELERGCRRIFSAIGRDFSDEFARMQANGLLDLNSRVGKAPGGYQSSLEEVRYPFIFMNAAGTDRDVFTLLHEGGHAFHAFAARNEPLLFYRHAPIEFCEVASMSMEMFAYNHLDAFYSNEDAQRSRRHHTEQLLTLFPWIAAVDAFQHWLYLSPNHSRAERSAKWIEIESRFSPRLDWSGLEPYHESLWQRQLHIFEVPFYYIEYGIAQLGALQLWLRHKQNPEAAVQGYRRGLALGGSRPLPELFQAAGARFDFSADTLRPIMEAIQDELADGTSAS